MLGCVFEYRPSSGNIAGASPALGIVAIASNYNVHEEPYGSKVSLCSSQYNVSGMPCYELLHPIECKRQTNILNRYLIRHSNKDADLALYDMCRVQVATEGMQSAYTCGELWVSYHVRLVRPAIGLSVSMVDYYSTLVEQTLSTLLVPTQFTLPAHTANSLGTEFRWDSAGGVPPCHWITFPPVTGDYFVSITARYGNGYPATQDSLLNLGTGDASAAITEVAGLASSVPMICGLGIGVEEYITNGTFHVNATTYNLNSLAHKRHRSVYYTPHANSGSNTTGVVTIWIMRLPDGLVSSPLVESSAPNLSLEIRAAVEAYMARDFPKPVLGIEQSATKRR
jgi:hypothetical protein